MKLSSEELMELKLNGTCPFRFFYNELYCKQKYTMIDFLIDNIEELIRTKLITVIERHSGNTSRLVFEIKSKHHMVYVTYKNESEYLSGIKLLKILETSPHETIP